MGTFWRIFWLYLRIALLVMILVFVALMVVANMGNKGSARVLPWMDDSPNIFPLLVAFALGVFLVPLGRTISKTFADYRVERERHRSELAEAAVRRARQGQSAAVQGADQAGRK